MAQVGAVPPRQGGPGNSGKRGRPLGQRGTELSVQGIVNLVTKTVTPDFKLSFFKIVNILQLVENLNN